MNERLIYPVAIFLGVVSLLFVRKIPIVVRMICVLVFSFISSALAITGNIASHRMAASKLKETPNSDWAAGALATRDEVQMTIMFWLLPMFLLGITCFFLLMELQKNMANSRTNHRIRGNSEK